MCSLSQKKSSNHSVKEGIALVISLASMIFLSSPLMATPTSRLWGKWAGTVTRSGTPTVFGIGSWERNYKPKSLGYRPKSLSVLVIFHPDGTGRFFVIVSKHDSSGNGTFFYSLRKNTLRMQTARTYDGNVADPVPTTGEEFPTEVYHVKINRGILLMKQRGHEVRFVLRRLIRAPKREGMSKRFRRAV